MEKAVAAGLSLDEVFQKMKNKPLDFRRECLIGDCAKQDAYRPRNVTSRPAGPNRLLVSAPGEGCALVVSSETAFPGWRVKVEGKERPVETINHSFRGVILENGETKAEFGFEPMTFRLGLFLALLVCAFWVVLGVGELLGLSQHKWQK